MSSSLDGDMSEHGTTAHAIQRLGWSRLCSATTHPLATMCWLWGAVLLVWGSCGLPPHRPQARPCDFVWQQL